MIGISRILVNDQEAPIGIEQVDQISWLINCKEGERNVIPKSYRIQLAYDESFETVIYDTRTVFSECSAHVKLTDLSLCSGLKYYLRIKIETNAGVGDWSRTFFVTALPDADELKAEFITFETLNDRDESRGSYVKKKVQIDKVVESAYAYATALGLYHFYINGQKVGQDEFAPGWTSYHKHLLYQTHPGRERGVRCFFQRFMMAEPVMRERRSQIGVSLTVNLMYRNR